MGIDNAAVGPDFTPATVLTVTGRDRFTVSLPDGPQELRVHGVNDGVPLPSPDAAATAFLASLLPAGAPVSVRIVIPADGDAPAQAIVLDDTDTSLASRLVLAEHANLSPYLRPGVPSTD